MFYPPHVDRPDPLAYERAARGYAPRKYKESFDRRLVADSVALFSRCEHLACMFSCSVIHPLYSSPAFQPTP